MSEDPLKGLNVPEPTKPHFDLIPNDVRGQLFAMYNGNTFMGSRNLAMFAILSDSELRREEVANLQLKNVDLDGGSVRVFSDKTEEWRWVPLTDETVYLVRNYLKWRERRARSFRAKAG